MKKSGYNNSLLATMLDRVHFPTGHVPIPAENKEQEQHGHINHSLTSLILWIRSPPITCEPTLSAYRSIHMYSVARLISPAHLQCIALALSIHFCCKELH